MKSISQYIAILLIALFAVTLLPYNALHDHAEDEHTAAMLHHENHPTHHCELDEQFCGAETDVDCGHPAHLAKAHPKCFTCDFNFIKLFDADVNAIVAKQVSSPVVFREYKTAYLHKVFIFVGNKGPPVVA
ncbi:MAG: hypothetical protein V4651_07780 [Bacteroidota bacterium]